MLDLFRLVGGLDIQNDTLSSNAYILQGSGAPGGDTGTQDAAPIGSLYLRTDLTGNKLQLYYKIGNANSAADWDSTTSKSYVDSAVAGISWREPAIVRDTTTTLPTGTAGSTITVDGVAISNGQRVLFGNLTVNPNVYIYDQASGTFVEDTNTATSGDALFVVSGTSIGNRWTYNGTGWVLFGAETDVSEIVYIDTFVGKSSIGSITPTYSSNFVVTTGNSLSTAIGSLDAAIGSGTITNTTASYSIDSSLVSAANPTGITITAALDKLNEAINNRTYTATDSYYPLQVNGESVTASLDKLNVTVHDIVVSNLEVAGTVSSTPATFAVVDTIPLTLATEVTWMVQVRENATPANRRASEVHAITDGTLVDFTRYAELKLGGSVDGYGIDVVISGTDITLQLKANVNYDYVVKRMAISNF